MDPGDVRNRIELEMHGSLLPDSVHATAAAQPFPCDLMDCENMVPATAPNANMPAGAKAPLSVSTKLTAAVASPVASPSRRPFGEHNPVGSPLPVDAVKPAPVSASAEIVKEVEAAAEVVEEVEVKQPNLTVEIPSTEDEAEADAESQADEEEAEELDFDSLDTESKLTVAMNRVYQLTEILEAYQSAEGQWMQEQQKLMYALDTTQQELWYTNSELAATKKKLRIVQGKRPAAEVEAEAQDERLQQLLGYVAELEEEVVTGRQNQSVLVSRMEYMDAQLNMLQDDLEQYQEYMQYAHQGPLTHVQMMQLLAEQHEMRAQNYELLVERQHLHAELQHMSDQMAEASYWREQLYEAQREAEAEDAEEDAAYKAAAPVSEKGAEPAAEAAAEAAVPSPTGSTGLSKTSELKWQLHLARIQYADMHMTLSELVHERDVYASYFREALTERDLYVSHACALEDHSCFLQVKLDQSAMALAEAEAAAPAVDDDATSEEGDADAAKEAEAEAPAVAAEEAAAEVEAESDDDAELTETEKLYLHNLMLDGHVKELVSQLEAHEEENELLLGEVTGQQAQMQEMMAEWQLWARESSATVALEEARALKAEAQLARAQLALEQQERQYEELLAREQHHSLQLEAHLLSLEDLESAPAASAEAEDAAAAPVAAEPPLKEAAAAEGETEAEAEQ